jgi:2-dehydropantoate 2-reductase
VEEKMAGDKFTVGAVGIGAVGTILATCLKEAGAEIIACDIPERIAQLKEHGLRVQWGDKLLEHAAETLDSIGSLADVNPDCIFVATKGCILPKIMPEVAKAAGDNCLVMSVQNGIGTEDEIAKYVNPANVGRMVVNYAGGFKEDGLVNVNWFNPPNFFGLHSKEEDSRLEKIVDLLNSVGLTSQLVNTLAIKKRAFLKTILNSALMPICAVMNLTMKEAMEGKATRRLASDLLMEGFLVASKLGYEYGDDIHEKCMGYLDKGGDHHPSMSVDLCHERPTEIEFINGKILEAGRTFEGLDLEVNRIMVSLLMTEEVRNGTRKPDEYPEYLFK